MKRLVLEKRDSVYRAHNDYVLALREYNFTDGQYVRKIQNLLNYHEEAQLILNQQWLVKLKCKKKVFEIIIVFFNRTNLLEKIADYMNNDLGPQSASVPQLSAIEPRHCYDELCRIHSKLVILLLIYF